MPILTRHQSTKFKLPFSLKIFLALVILVLLLVFKGIFYRLEKNEKEQTQEESGVVQKKQAVSGGNAASVLATEKKQPELTASTTKQILAPGAALQAIGKIKITQTPTGFAHIRDFPGLSGSILFTVPTGSILQYSSQKNGWYQITSSSGQTGWVFGQYVTTNLAAAQIPPTTLKPPIIKKSSEEESEINE